MSLKRENISVYTLRSGHLVVSSIIDGQLSDNKGVVSDDHTTFLQDTPAQVVLSAVRVGTDQPAWDKYECTIKRPVHDGVGNFAFETPPFDPNHELTNQQQLALTLVTYLPLYLQSFEPDWDNWKVVVMCY